jgi:hypothetical protein
MSPVRTIEAFAIDRVKDYEILPQPPGCPIPASTLRQLLENCPVVLINPDTAVQDSLPFNDANTEIFGLPANVELSQVSPSHKRSFDVTSEQFALPWQDEYDNRYASFSLKGNNFSNPGILQHPTASEGFIAYGLQESSIIERVLKTSELLRSHNISTEYIVGVSELKTYPWPIIDGQTDASETISLKEYKRRVIDNYWNALSDGERTIETFGELHAKFKDMTFYVSLRATDSPHRLGDIRIAANREKLFSHINTHLLTYGEEPLDPTSYDDRLRYLRDHFSPAIGVNIARLHNAKLGHKFTHSLNLTALGGIVDLDSVYGEPLGFDDEPLTPHGRCVDITGVLESLEEVVGQRSLISPDHSTELAFLDAYYAETLRLSSDPSVTTELTATLVEVSEIFYLEDDEMLASAMQQRFNLPTTTDFKVNDPIGLGLLMEEFKSNANEIDFESMDLLMSSIEEVFLVDIDVFALLINQEVTDDINRADYEQRPFNAYDAFMSSEFKNNSEAYRELRKIVQRECGANLEVMLRHKLSANELGVRFNSHQGLVNFAHTEISDLMQSLTPKMDAITHNLYVTHAAKLRQSAEFYRPPSVLGDVAEKTWLHDPIQDSRFWRLSEEIKLNDVIQYLAKVGCTYTSMELEITGKKQTDIFIPKGSILREIIVDSSFDGLTHSTDDYGVTVEIEHVEIPTYVFVVGELSDGTLEYALYVEPAIEAKVASKEGLIQLGQLALF